MTISRRSFTKGLGALVATAGLSAACSGRRKDAPGASASPAPTPRASEPPGARYCVLLFMRGGIDAIYTTDPKRRADVEPDIDVPYELAADARTGPHLSPLAASLGKLAIINGVQVHTANHETGAAQIARLRTGVLPAMPTLLDIVGSSRDDIPLASVALGPYNGADLMHSQRWFSEEQLQFVMQSSAEDRASLARSFRRQAATMSSNSRRSLEYQITRENLTSCAAFAERLASTPEPVALHWNSGTTATGPANSLQQAVWLLENDLTKTILVRAFLPWDTHSKNAEGQARVSLAFFDILQQFLTELGRRSNSHGLLADRTRVILTSEVGRFPRLNGDAGKDHFPEVPMMFYGPKLAAGTFGQTGRQMESLPISLRTGKHDDAGHLISLDDVGATMLRSFGHEPHDYGYTGKMLDFLEAT